jgi:hypothetical protein
MKYAAKCIQKSFRSYAEYKKKKVWNQKSPLIKPDGSVSTTTTSDLSHSDANNGNNKKGFFYYQLKKGMSSKISYMRWSNAFMFNAMSYYLKEKLGV